MGTDELEQLVHHSLLPMKLGDHGELQEIIICSAISGGQDFVNDMPRMLTLLRMAADGTSYSADYAIREVDYAIGIAETLGNYRLIRERRGSMSDVFESTDDKRVQKNIFRHQYRQLTGKEKEQMQKVKDQALVLYNTLTEIGSSREISIAKTRLEECVMWGVKHITG